MEKERRRQLTRSVPFVSLAVCFRQAVVFSQGALVLDHCDFSGSSAQTLVFSEGDNATSRIRNSVLGNTNC